MNSLRFFSKSFLRIVVDSCILPGTTLGTEILWLYMKQWKREFSGILFAILSLIFFHSDVAADIRSVVSQTLSDRD